MLRSSGKEQELTTKNASLIRHEARQTGKKFPPLATRRTKSSLQPQAPMKRKSWVARGTQEYWGACLYGHHPLLSIIASFPSKFAPTRRPCHMPAAVCQRRPCRCRSDFAVATPPHPWPPLNPRAAASAATVTRSVTAARKEVGEDFRSVHATHLHDMQSRRPRQCRPAQGRPLLCVGGRRLLTVSLVFSFPCCHTWRQDSAFTLPAAHRSPRHLQQRQRQARRC